MIAVGRILQGGILELLQQERLSLEPVPAVAAAAVGEKADHGLVDLNAAGSLRAVGGSGPFGALRRDGARALRDEEPDEDLQRPRLGRARFLSGQSQEQDIGHVPAAESLFPRYPAQAAGLVIFGGNGGADHDAVEPQIPRQRFGSQPRDALAHQRAPRDRRGDGSEDRIARGSCAQRFEELQEQRFAAAIADRFQHRLGTGIVRLGSSCRKQRARILVDLDRTQIKAFVAGVKQSASSAGSPTRFVSAATAMSSMARSFSPAISCTRGSAKFASSGRSASSRTECPCTLVTCVFGSMTVAPDLSFMFWRGITAPI